MLLSDLVSISDEVSSTSSRLDKRAALAGFLRRLVGVEKEIAISYLSGKPTQSRLGVGPSTLLSIDSEPARTSTLTLVEVDRILQQLSETSGPGSKARRQSLLADLFSRSTGDEQAFLRGLIARNLRQGALEGIMVESVADALGVPADRVRRAAMVEGDLVSVASRALTEGESALSAASLQVFTPVQPMLAKTAASAGEAVEEMGEALVEAKLDGLRLQVHRSGDSVAIFTRNLRDVTEEFPSVVQQVVAYPSSEFILDGEGLLTDEKGRPKDFQDSMSGTRGESALSAFFFDVLAADGEELIDSPLRRRRQVLESLVTREHRVDFVVTAEPAEADRFFDDAVSHGFEGVVVKDLDQPYAAGRRGSGWLKVKPVHTLDLVVLAAEWGSGRRKGWLSNLHLGARSDDGFVMLGKTFKGLTDEMLAWQTETFLGIESKRERHIVHVAPQIVYEIAFDGVQRSSRYPGGVALRFARVKGYRDDKGPGEADTIETVRGYLR